MTERNYHFRIPASNVYDFVRAASLVEARAKAFEEYGPWYNQIEWLDADTPELQQR